MTGEIDQTSLATCPLLILKRELAWRCAGGWYVQFSVALVNSSPGNSEQVAPASGVKELAISSFDDQPVVQQLFLGLIQSVFTVEAISSHDSEGCGQVAIVITLELIIHSQ